MHKIFTCIRNFHCIEPPSFPKSRVPLIMYIRHQLGCALLLASQTSELPTLWLLMAPHALMAQRNPPLCNVVFLSFEWQSHLFTSVGTSVLHYQIHYLEENLLHSGGQSRCKTCKACVGPGEFQHNENPRSKRINLCVSSHHSFPL